MLKNKQLLCYYDSAIWIHKILLTYLGWSYIYVPVICFLLRYKLPENRDHFMSNATRSRIVDYILRRKEYCEEGEPFVFGLWWLFQPE